MEKLGIELPLLVSQIVNVTILIVILNKLLYKPILKVLKDRKKKIEESLSFAERVKKEEETLEGKHQEVLKKARDEARLILEEAKKDGKRVKEEIFKEGKSEVDQLKLRQEKELQVKEEQLEREISAHTVDISIEILRRIIPEVLKEKDQHAIITRQLKEMEKIYEKKEKSDSHK